MWRMDPSEQSPAGSFVVGEDASPATRRRSRLRRTAACGPLGSAHLRRGDVAARRSNRLGSVSGGPVRVRAPATDPRRAQHRSSARRLDVLGLMHIRQPPESSRHTQLLPGSRSGTFDRAPAEQQRRVDVPRHQRERSRRRRPRHRSERADLAGGNGLATIILATQRPGTLRATASGAGYVGDTIGVRCC